MKKIAHPMRRDRIIFLDIDGVLNTIDAYGVPSNLATRPVDAHTGRLLPAIEQAPAQNLSSVIAKTGAVIVVSSGWRLLVPVATIARHIESHVRGAVVYGWTPDLGGDAVHDVDRTPRGNEIRQWLHDFGSSIESYVVIDDRDDMESVRHRHVQTSPYVGLDRAGASMAITLLQRPRPVQRGRGGRR